MELNSDTILYGGAGLGAGYALGWLLKKAMKLLFKMILVVTSFFIFGLVYLENIKVITINANAMDSFLNNSVNTVNKLIGTQCDINKIVSSQEVIGGELFTSECINTMTNPFEHIFYNLGIPVTMGIGLGFVLGWMRG